MVCGSCGAKIAEKAIVCYRCGTATAMPVVVTPRRTSASRPWAAVVGLVVLGIVAGWFAFDAPTGSARQVLLTVVGASMTIAGGYLAWRRPA